MYLKINALRALKRALDFEAQRKRERSKTPRSRFLFIQQNEVKT
jgi:hypothetical protein